MKQVLVGFALVFGLTACEQSDQSVRTTLSCELSHLGKRENATTAATQIERRIEATSLDDSEPSVWNFRGTIGDENGDSKSSQANVFYHRFEDGSFELVVEAGTERIVVMPGNEILQERGLQGVTFQKGGRVSTGAPLTASCETQTPESQ